MADSVGVLYVDLKARVDQLERQVQQQASTVGRKAGTTMGGGMAAGIQKAVLPAIAALGTAAAIVDFAKAAEEAATANARIEQVARSMELTGGAYSFATSRVRDYAEELSRSIAVDDETIKLVQAKLLTFRSLGETMNVAGGQFDRATKAAFDLAAAGFGSAEQASVQLGKALQDPIKGLTALARSGVTFTEAEKSAIAAMVEAGEIGKAQEKILSAIESQVGGVAEATANASDQMAVAWSNIQEQLGESLLPIVEGWSEALTILGDTIGSIKDSFDSIGDTISAATGRTIEFGEATDWVANLPLPFALRKIGEGLEWVADTMERARLAAVGLSVALGRTDRIEVKGIKEAGPAAEAAASGLAAYTDAAGDATTESEGMGNAVDQVAAAYEAMAARGQRALDAMRQTRRELRAVKADMNDMRFEASLYGLDEVTASVRRLARAEADLRRARDRDAGAVTVAERERDVLAAQIAVNQARADAASQAREEAQAAAEQAAEVARQAREALAEAVSGDFVKGIVEGTGEQIADALRGVAANLRGAVPAQVADGIAAMLRQSNQQLQAAAVERDRVTRQLEAAQAKLQELVTARASLVNTLRSQSFGSLVSYADEASAEQNGRTPTASQARQAIVARLQQRVQEIREFGANIKRLAARGLPQYLLNEIIQAGPDAGGPTARLLAASNDYQFNQIKSAAQSLYQESRSVAQQAGKVMYDAGIQSAIGLVKGLQAQERAIQSQMIRIANMMVRTIRRALGIRSPSTVFAGLGENIGEGLIGGMESTRTAVSATAASLVAVPRPSPTLSPTVTASGGPGSPTRAGSGLVVQNLIVNNPAAEPASTSVAGGLRRAAFMFGRP